jgi:cell volume regulation protein A
MGDVEAFGRVVLVAGVVVMVGVLANRISVWMRVPAAAIFLLGAALASDIDPALYELRFSTVEQVVTVALVVILFDGGMEMGWRRLRRAVGAALLLGVVGTVATAGLVAAIAHLLFRLDWLESLLVGIALAPTDPAVVFSVLGSRRIAGRSGTILAGEAGLNDPVGIALMVTVLSASSGGSGGASLSDALVSFSVQMLVGVVVGVVGGRLLLASMRRMPLPSEGLYPLRALAGALVVYGAATVAHGSGFMAVFLAGIVVGTGRAPYKSEVEQFSSALASFAEIAAFVVLGITVSLQGVIRSGAWTIGLGLAALLAFAVRPLVVGLLALPFTLRWGERGFVALSGLKGAVPILLAAFVVVAQVPNAVLLYHVVFVVVAFSVIVQGGLLPLVARLFGVSMQTVELRPWALGVRLHHEPESLQRHVVSPTAPAEGRTVDDLQAAQSVWVSFVVRRGRLVQVAGDTVLMAGDEVLALADPQRRAEVATLFSPPAS